MKTGIKIFLLCIAIYVLLIAIVCLIHNHKHKEYVIDLPEEYSQISKDQERPDTLTSYIKNDTLHIEFLKHY